MMPKSSNFMKLRFINGQPVDISFRFEIFNGVNLGFMYKTS